MEKSLKLLSSNELEALYNKNGRRYVYTEDGRSYIISRDTAGDALYGALWYTYTLKEW